MKLEKDFNHGFNHGLIYLLPDYLDKMKVRG